MSFIYFHCLLDRGQFKVLDSYFFMEDYYKDACEHWINGGLKTE